MSSTLELGAVPLRCHRLYRVKYIRDGPRPVRPSFGSSEIPNEVVRAARPRLIEQVRCNVFERQPVEGQFLQCSNEAILHKHWTRYHLRTGERDVQNVAGLLR